MQLVQLRDAAIVARDDQVRLHTLYRLLKRPPGAERTQSVDPVHAAHVAQRMPWWADSSDHTAVLDEGRRQARR